jgi:hypothetical protein
MFYVEKDYIFENNTKRCFTKDKVKTQTNKINKK